MKDFGIETIGGIIFIIYDEQPIGRIISVENNESEKLIKEFIERVNNA
jgi:hypothetical protein